MRPETRDRPGRVHVELTTHCNLSCVFCSHSDDADARHIAPEVYGTVRDELLPKCCETELQGTGESLLFPRFDEILARAEACGCLINLITNGLLLTRRRLTRLVQAGCQLVVSVDGGTRQTYEWHRPGARFSQLVTNLQQWSSARRHGSVTAHTPALTLHMALTALNIHELGAVLLLAAKVRADGLFVSVVRNARRLDSVWRSVSLDDREAQVQDELLATEARARELGVAFGSSTPIGDDSQLERHRCPAPWEHVYISAAGDVFPCCQFRRTMGSCRDRAFSEIWHGSAFTSLRQEMAAGALPPECRDCVLPWARPRRQV